MLDVITIGRASVDLYGEQIGGRLEDMNSFQKYLGGSPANVAVGTARLGLRSALISAVGDEHMGRFIIESLKNDGVDTSSVKVDKEKLTALVLLGISSKDSFPLIFYRENCADMGLTEKDLNPAQIKNARCLVITGTHLSHPQTRDMVLLALKIARENGVRTVLDIDYRPNLWGLSGHGDGENRFIESKTVSKQLQTVLKHFDLIVGTEEEFNIAGGKKDTLASIKTVREFSSAVLVCKRGSQGAVLFANEIGNIWQSGLISKGLPVEIFNVLGAGDGFLSGLLVGWLGGETWQSSLLYANICGAFAVSRHGCAPAYPSHQELEFFITKRMNGGKLKNNFKNKPLRFDAELEQIHWATVSRKKIGNLLLFDGKTKIASYRSSFVARRPVENENFNEWPVNHCLFVEDNFPICEKTMRAAGLRIAVNHLRAKKLHADWIIAPQNKLKSFAKFATELCEQYPHLQGIFIMLKYLPSSKARSEFIAEVANLNLPCSFALVYNKASEYQQLQNPFKALEHGKKN